MGAKLGGKITAETKEEKTVSFVGAKEAWQRMVESIYSPQTKLLSQQADLLADIDTGQGDIVDAVQDVEAAVKNAFAGGRATIAEGQPQTKFEKRQEEKQEKWDAWRAGLRGRKAPQTERETLREGRRRERARAREEKPEPVVPPKLKPKEYDRPEWPRPATVDFKNVETPKAEIEAPQIDVPRIETPAIETPRIDVPRIETPQIETPRIDVPKVEVPEIPALAIRRDAEPERATGKDRGGLGENKDVRTLIDEVRRMHSSLKKLAPIGAVGP
ncbi:MAG: hypothetical protein ACYSUV_21110 [Planctomycetota bacterium]